MRLVSRLFVRAYKVVSSKQFKYNIKKKRVNSERLRTLTIVSYFYRFSFFMVQRKVHIQRPLR